MKWRPFFLFFLFLLITGEPLSAGKRAKESSKSSARQLTSIRELYQFARGAEHEGLWRDAFLGYQKILQINEDEVLDPHSKADVEIRLGFVLLALGEIDKADEVLAEIQKEELSVPLQLQSSLLLLKLRHHQGRPLQAYLALHQIDTLSQRQEWSASERSLMEEVEEAVEGFYQRNLSKAERLFDAAAHEEASALYQKVLGYLDQGLFPGDRAALTAKVRYRLAQSAFLRDDFSTVVETLTAQDLAAFESHPDLWEIFQNTTYLLGRAYQQLNRDHEAIEEYQRYLSFADVSDLRYADEVVWELGHAYYRIGDRRMASDALKKVPEKKRRLHTLAQLFLGRIAVQEKRYSEAESILSALSVRIKEESAHRYEIAYLRGEALYQLDDPLGASDYFVAALPTSESEHVGWYAPCLERLASCYLILAEDPNQNYVNQSHYFDNAEATLRRLLSVRDDEATVLELGRVYLAKLTRFKDASAYDRLEKLLSKEHTFSSLERDMEALMIRAEAAPDFNRRQARYRELTNKAYAKSRRYVEGWYYRGLNAYEEGRVRRERGEGARKLMREAVDSFAKAVDLTKENPSERTGLALKYQAEALYTLGGKEEVVEAIALCEELITKQEKIWQAMAHPEEVLYLQGLMAAQLAASDPNYAEVAEGALRWIYVEYPDGHQVDDALNLLGRLHFQQERFADAEQTFATLAERFPDSRYAGEAWYWAAQAASRQGKSRTEIAAYRRTLIDLYPNTEGADEIYFNAYSYGEYLQSGEESIAHLGEMPNLYPSSPYLIIAHYLIGLDQKRDRFLSERTIPRDLTSAIEHFKSAVSLFDFLAAEDALPEKMTEALVKIRYQARLERSQTELLISEHAKGAKREIYIDYAEKTFRDVLISLRDPNLPYRKLLVGESEYPRLQEDAEFGLVQVYRMRGKLGPAKELLREMFRSYSEAGTTRGYNLSRVWREQGLLSSLPPADPQLALDAYRHALEAGAGLLALSERLDLWLLTAQSYKQLGEFDEAMRLLSQVVNEEAPPAIKAEAMYLRSEVYEAMKRPKLQLRQLKACAAKEGVWAEKAREKLKEYELYH